MAKIKNPQKVKQGRSARHKGAAGEREAAEQLNNLFNVQFHRGRQYHGGPGTPDIISESEDPNQVLEEVHFEVKRTESLSLYTALDQAKRDSKEGQIPVVLHRRSRKPWLTIVELDHLPELVRVMHPYLKGETPIYGIRCRGEACYYTRNEHYRARQLQTALQQSYSNIFVDTYTYHKTSDPDLLELLVDMNIWEFYINPVTVEEVKENLVAIHEVKPKLGSLLEDLHNRAIESAKVVLPYLWIKDDLSISDYEIFTQPDFDKPPTFKVLVYDVETMESI